MPVVPVQPHAGRIPLLENGDRLTRSEFERRYMAMSQVKKAELIEGVVHMPSPVRLTAHGKPHTILAGWLVRYISGTPGLNDYGDNATVRLDEDNEYQSDLLLLLPAHAGGAARVDEDGFVNGPPELVCEVAASSVSIDLHGKLNAYRRNRVREYLVWRTEDRAVDFFVFHDGRYEPQTPTPENILKSSVFPGLWLDVDALLQSSLPRLMQVLDQGIATAEHAAFVQRLQADIKGT